MKLFAEVVHHVVAHPLWGLAIAARVAAVALERAAEQLHAATARAAWGDDVTAEPTGILAR